MEQADGYDGSLGTAGGSAFGQALRAVAELQGFADAASLAEASGLEANLLERVGRGEARLAVAALARLALALRLRPIEFLQKTQLLSLEVYAFGLDPLYFLPDGPIRYEAVCIYARRVRSISATPFPKVT